MYIPFQSLPPHSKVWIYQADKILSEEQKHIISQRLHAFTEAWTVHGVDMETSYDIAFNQFIVLAANDHASGCSIDHSVRTIKSIGENLDIDFFNRDLIAFKKENGISLIPMKELKAKLNEGQWNVDSLVFNNLVSTKGDLEKMWLLPAGATWLKRYLPTQTISQ